jgi:putative ABC transport system ATP-binding protein
MKYIYEIENLTCNYIDEDTNNNIEVLDVENVSIVRGEITIILGPSGSGKSTFMEAISLMSDTINVDKSEKVIFYPESDKNNPIDFVSLRKKFTSETKIGANLIRKKLARELQPLRFNNFSFIFQDTNIMGNFNPKENVALPKMVYAPKGSINEANDILRDHLNLKLDLDKKAIEYSGGQKQRFAFARAFMAKGGVLFGDEPTGNLDKYNSEKLFWVLKQHVTRDKNTEGSIFKTGAIVVTHSIDLALKFADRIIVIVKPEKFENISEEKKKNMEVVRGYVNPFLVYNNFEEGKWREDKETVDLMKSDFLPPIDDDGSNKFKFLDNGNDELIKDKLKREIIFYLNNSYAFAQKILVEFAKELNISLQELRQIPELPREERKKKELVLFNFFDMLKTEIIQLIEDFSDKKIDIDEFEEKLIDLLKQRKPLNSNELFNEIMKKVEPELKAWLIKYGNQAKK